MEISGTMCSRRLHSYLNGEEFATTLTLQAFAASASSQLLRLRMSKTDCSQHGLSLHEQRDKLKHGRQA